MVIKIRKKDMTFKSLDSLKLLEKVINVALEALVDAKRLNSKQRHLEVLGAALGGALTNNE